MWAIIGIMFTGAFITFFEIPPLVKKKCWREIMVFFLLLTPGLALSVLLSKNVNIPTPLDLITKIYSPVITFIDQILS
ncbi:MAG: hypothetical protein ACQEWV_15225 [Bacillota bacterium]